MNPLHSLIKSELFYSVQVLVMKISTGFSTLLESFLNCSATMRCSFPRYSESMGWNVRCMQLNLALTVHIQVVYFCFSLPQHELQWALARRRLNLAGPQQLSMTMTELFPNLCTATMNQGHAPLHRSIGIILQKLLPCCDILAGAQECLLMGTAKFEYD